MLEMQTGSAFRLLWAQYALPQYEKRDFWRIYQRVHLWNLHFEARQQQIGKFYLPSPFHYLHDVMSPPPPCPPLLRVLHFCKFTTS